MSLDFYLELDEPRVIECGPRIFVRREGANVEISRDEWNRLHPGTEPVTFAAKEESSREVYWANITHNLGRMADAAGIYDALWRGPEAGLVKAAQLIEPLQRGLTALRADPAYYERFNSPNGWGLYKHLVPFVEQVLAACREHPAANVRVSR